MTSFHYHLIMQPVDHDTGIRIKQLLNQQSFPTSIKSTLMYRTIATNEFHLHLSGPYDALNVVIPVLRAAFPKVDIWLPDPMVAGQAPYYALRCA